MSDIHEIGTRYDPDELERSIEDRLDQEKKVELATNLATDTEYLRKKALDAIVVFGARTNVDAPQHIADITYEAFRRAMRDLAAYALAETRDRAHEKGLEVTRIQWADLMRRLAAERGVHLGRIFKQVGTYFSRYLEPESLQSAGTGFDVAATDWDKAILEVLSVDLGAMPRPHKRSRREEPEVRVTSYDQELGRFIARAKELIDENRRLRDESERLRAEVEDLSTELRDLQREREQVLSQLRELLEG